MTVFRNENWLGCSPTILLPRLRSLAADVEKLMRGEPVSFDEQPVRIDDWVLMRRAVPCLAGTMIGHPTVRDGGAGITSEIYYIDESLGIARSLSRWYRLDDPMLGGDFS
ncbi:hypothetical protein ABIA24_000922 [Sinorhizobium fredii]|uniref:hypothetical protein n=1 Tax=Rhizobium fredii TaxID=380 RepID=UPI003519B9A5